MVTRKVRSGAKRIKRAAVRSTAARSQLARLTKSEFLSTLEAGKILKGFVVMPEKKKRELWTEPEGGTGLAVGAVLKRVRTEKKKVELEVPIGLKPSVERAAANSVARELTRLGGKAIARRARRGTR